MTRDEIIQKMRDAVDQQNALWDTLGEIERAIGEESEGVKEEVDHLCIVFDSGKEVPQEDMERAVDWLLEGVRLDGIVEVPE